ncbi:MAG TPA: type II CAAX endopeptidase family protein [Candidatus Binatia bacterium]|nr:type II CAAX endopeptidase family protein [Candidatus Binatia bacterium]
MLDDTPAWIQRAAGALRPSPGRSRPASTVPWDWTDIALFFAVFLTGWLLISALALSPAVQSWGDSLLRGVPTAERTAVGSLTLQTAVYVMGLAVILVLALGRRHGRLADLGWRWPRWWWLPLGVVAAAASYEMLTLISDVLQALFPQVTNGQIPEVQGEYGTYVGFAIPAVSVVAPIVEETFFRGFVYGWMRRQLNVPAASVLSGIFFALLHFQPIIVLPLAVLGVGLALLYEYSGSLLPGMIVHALFNLVEIVSIV